MPKELKQISSEQPLCIRFKPGDLDKVGQAASKMGVYRSVWIREAVLDRANQILSGEKLEALKYETAGGEGEQICVRFRPRDFSTIQKAARREGVLPSPWIRAVVLQQADKQVRKSNGSSNGVKRRSKQSA